MSHIFFLLFVFWVSHVFWILISVRYIAVKKISSVLCVLFIWYLFVSLASLQFLLYFVLLFKWSPTCQLLASIPGQIESYSVSPFHHLRSVGHLPMLSSISVSFWGFTFKSLINFGGFFFLSKGIISEFISFFFMWTSSFHSSTCWSWYECFSICSGILGDS